MGSLARRGGNWQLASTTVLGSATASPVIPIPQGFSDFKIVVDRLRTDRAGQNNEQIQIRLNGDTTAGHYIWAENRGQIAAMSNTGNATDSVMRPTQAPGASSAAGITGDTTVTCYDYMSTTNFKNLNCRGVWANGDGANISNQINGGVWMGTPAAVTGVTWINQNGSNFVAGTRFRVYVR